ncbi:uncharacterized protein LOC129594256 [Paramacrobiotus metropolitanus]|uniref:uncharacterized protein LOC129594256 n=1 Tax=Paramacrobiotus metropolitanus TaxID=2943436 RepID=UPI002445A163|nr:uncharacterized protein LOC129594256 [Paramacrobiotus metropolitanus]
MACTLSVILFVIIVLQLKIMWISAQSAGITDSNTGKLNFAAKTESSQVQYFVTTDVRLLIYQTDTARNSQIEKIRNIWCQLLTAKNDCSSVQFFSWKASKEPPKSGTSIKEIAHFVIASPKFKPEVIDDAIRSKFDQLLLKNSYWGISAVTKGRNAITDTMQTKGTGSDPFALMDSVWMTYSNDDTKTQLLVQLKSLWQKTLGKGVSRLELHLVQIIPKSTQEFGAEPVKVMYLLFGDSTGHVDVDQVKLKIRQLISAARMPALLGTPFQWSSDLKALTVADVAPNPDGVLTVTHSNIIAYANNDERDQGMELIRKLWAFILNVPLTTMELSLNSTTKIRSVGPLIDDRQINNCTFIIQCSTKYLNADVIEATQKFQRLLDLTSIPFMVDTPVPVVNMTALFGYVAVTQDLFWMPANVFVLQNSTNSTTSIKDLLNTNVHLIHDKVRVYNATVETSSLFLRPLHDLWKEVLGDDAVEVQIALSNRETTSENIINVSYTVVFVSELSSWDIEAAKSRFRQLATSSADSLYVKLEPETSQLPTAILEYTRSNTKIFVIFDTVNLAYQTDKVPDLAIKALQQAWTSIIGPKAWNIRFWVYHAGSEQTFSLAGDQGMPITKLYFRVGFYCNNSEWNTTALKVKFRELVPLIRNSSLLLSVTDIDVVPQTTTPATTTTTTAPSSTDSSVSTITPSGAVFSDTIIFSYPNETQRNQILSQLRKLWADVLGQDVFDVRISVTNDNVIPTNQSANTTNHDDDPHEISYSVIPSSNQKIDVSAAKAKFQGLVQNSTIFKQRNNNLDFPDDTRPQVDVDNSCKQQWSVYGDDKEKVIHSYVTIGEIVTNQSSHILPLLKNFTLNFDWAIQAYLTILNEESIVPNGTFNSSIRYAVTVLTSNSSLESGDIYQAVKKRINDTIGSGTDSPEFRNINCSDQSKDSSLIVIVDSVQIIGNNNQARSLIMRDLFNLWKNASRDAGNVNSTVDPNIFKSTLAPLLSVANNQTVYDIRYMLRITKPVGVNFTSKSIQQKFAAIFARYFNNTDVVYRDAIAFKQLNRTSAPATTLTTAPVSTFTDSIILQYSTTAERDLAFQELGKLWAISLGIRLDAVRLFLLDITLLSTTSSQKNYDILYAVVYYPEKSISINITAANITLHSYLSNAYNVFITDQLDKGQGAPAVANATIQFSASYFANGVTFPEVAVFNALAARPKDEDHSVKPYIIQDTLRLYYENLTVRDGAIVAFQAAWSGLLGSDAMFIQLAAYAEFPPYINDLESGSKTHQLYYVVVILSRNHHIDFSAKQEQFRQFVMDGNVPYVVNFDEIYPTPEVEPLNIFTVVEASNSTSFVNITSSSDVENAVSTLYKIAIGSDARVVHAWNHDEAVTDPTNNVTVVTRYQLVLVVTNNTLLAPIAVEQKFRDLLLMTSVSAIQSGPSTKLLLKSLMDNDTNLMDDAVLVGFRDSVRLDSAVQTDQNETASTLRQAWARALDSRVSNITVTLDTILPETYALDAGPSSYTLQYTVLGLLDKSVLNINGAKTQVYGDLHLNVSPANYPITTTSTSTQLPILLP